jgi:hypothetical protein
LRTLAEDRQTVAKTTGSVVTQTFSPKSLKEGQKQAECSPASACSESTVTSEAKETQRSLWDDLKMADWSEYSDSGHDETDVQDNAGTGAF